jgi:hypothetical protein
MKLTAREFSDVQFLAFTKMHHLNFRNTPRNLAIYLSMWPEWGNTRKKMPRAWFDDGTDKRIPESAFICPGSKVGCMKCGYHCWTRKEVVFPKH